MSTGRRVAVVSPSTSARVEGPADPAVYREAPPRVTMAASSPIASTAEAALIPLESDDFVACYGTHYRRLVRALQLAGAPSPVAEDVAQEAFARMLSRWSRVRRGSSPAGYAYRTAFRLLARKRAFDQDHAGRPVPAGAGNEGCEAGPEGLATTRVAIEAALAAMPPRRRACAVICLVVGLPVAETAGILGIAEGTVRKHLEEARTDLKVVL